MHDDGTLVGTRGHPAVFAFYANKQMTTGEGGMVVLRRGDVKERIDSERNQGRAPDMDWLDHDRLGFNYRLSDLQCALGDRAARAPRRRCSPPAPASRRWYGEALAGDRGPHAARRRSPARSWFVYVVQLPRGVDRDATIVALRERGVQSKPYLPAIHLMSFYRERLRPPRGRVPGLRGRRRALARAAVLPAARRRPRSSRWPTRSRRRSQP